MAAPSKQGSNSMKFAIGGTAGMVAALFVHPFDLIKTRMQIGGTGGKGVSDYKNCFQCFSAVVKNDGVIGLYGGIGAALLRQATYTTTRLGIYTYLNESYRKDYRGAPPILMSMMMGMVAGGCGAFVGTPADVVMIRMMTDKKLPESERRNYKNVAEALMRISKEEGLLALWRGCIPTMCRAMALNMIQLGSYSQFKNYFNKGPLQLRDGLFLHFVSSMCSGVLTTIATMPLDIAKTRVQNMNIVDGKAEYSGMLDVLIKIVKMGGVPALWNGFTPYFFGMGPHTVLTFIFLEQLTKLYQKHALGIEGKGSGI